LNGPFVGPAFEPNNLELSTSNGELVIAGGSGGNMYINSSVSS
jgi:hypothetical protein